MPPRVDDVEIEDHLDVARALQRGDRLRRGHVLGEGEDARVHDAARRLFGVFEQLADVAAGGALLHQLEHRRRHVLRKVVDDRGGVVRRQLLEQLADLFGRPSGEQRRTAFGSELAERFHGQPAVAFDQERERGLPILVAELGEDLREVGRMLLLEQIDEVRRRAYAKEAFDGVQHDIELALRHGSRVAANGNCPM